EEKRAKPEKLITRFARYYTPAVIIAALFIGLVVPLVFRQNLANWVHRALIFLVISCPCALVISVPLTYFAGIGGGSKKGILFKGADVLDALADTAVVIFDKTGTLTSGKFTVTDVVPNKITRGDLLKIAAYAESMSSHPIARSIIETSGVNINRNEILNFHEERGMGCAAELKGGIIVAAGSAQFLKMVGVEAGPVKTGGSVIHIAAGGRYAGYIVLGDSVKADATNIVNRLAKAGVSRVAMFTGDNKEAANNAAGVLGISEVYSDCLPQDKMRYLNAIRSMLGKKEKLVFVGDGINDAPVIAASDIGIAMGGIGSDAAIEAAGVVIMTDEPSKVADAVAKARETKQIVRQNIIISIAIKVIIMVLAVCDVAPMWLGVGADVGVALLAILNATRAFGAKTDAKSGN
ncbi:MAG: heavy metal translocating P-type ATPase, partial [Oscillospiraceae bacterium]|nr:heavy metal translocating P-type ATPase [Oscillospiraceae bacterium]